MRCCLTFCSNSRDYVSPVKTSGSKQTTFHKFPTTPCLRVSWLVGLGIEESQLPEAPLVCSQHFQKEDFYNKNGITKLRSNAVPSAVQVCLICLDTTRKLYALDKFNLKEAYVNVTGILSSNKINLAQKVCAECAQRLANCNSFREKSLRAHTLLLDLVEKHDSLTNFNINTINRESNRLTSTIARRVYQPDHCDLYLVDDKEEKLYNVPVVKDEVEGRNDDLFNSLENANNRVLEPKEETENCEIKNDDGFSNDDEVKFMANDFNYVGVTNDDFDDDAEFSNSEVDFSNIDNKPELPKVDEEVLHKKRIEKGSLKRIRSKSSVKRIKSKDSIRKIKSKTKIKSTNDPSKRKVKLRNGIIKLKNGKKKSANANIEDCKVKPAKDEKKLFKKTILSYEEQLADVQQRKETANYLNARYKCTTCYKGFLDVDAYNGHMIKHTNKYGPFECDICGLHSKSRNNLCRHIVVNHSIRYSCTLCMFVTMHVGTANSHERWHKGSKFKCPECDLEFGIRSSYLSHLRIKHPSDYACTVCGFSFIGERGIKLHMNKKHRFHVQNPEGPLCKPCNIRFASEMAYNQHMKVSPKHNIGQKRERNDPLIKTIYWRKRPWSGKSKKEDPDCVEGEPVECEQCGIPLKDYWMYTQHFKKAHPDKNRTKYQGPKLLCELCGKVFNNEAQLRYHMPVHSEHKQFKCEVCSKSFGSILNLKSHATMHSETRPSYACDFCGKTFAYQSNKYRHMTIHKGIKFSCEICGKSFNTAPERSIHVQHVHMKVPWPKRNRGPRNKTRLITQEELM